MAGTILLLSLAGVLLVIAEMFLPGMIAGTLGFLAFCTAAYLSYATYGFETGNLTVAAFLFLGCVLFCCWLYIFPRTPFARKLTLTATVKSDHPDFSELVGHEGIALTQLRPSGMALIDGRKVDVLAESGFISAQERVKVLQTEGARVVVRKQSTLQG